MKHIALFLVVLNMLFACATVDKGKPMPPPERVGVKKSVAPSDTREARQRIAQGDFAGAANIYRQLANQSEPPKKQLWKMEAARMFMAANRFANARALLDDIDTNPLDAEQRNNYVLLQVTLALQLRQPQNSMQWLEQFALSPDTPVAQQSDYRDALIRTYELNGQTVDAVRERIVLDSLLTDAERKIANQQQIIQTLILLPESALHTMLQSSPSPVMKGWLELSLMALQTPDPSRLANLLAHWNARNPQHPVSDATLDLLAPRGGEESMPPSLDQIGLLLPLEGAFENAATAVRDGFLSAYYDLDDTQRQRSIIRIYNTGSHPQQAPDVYQQALDDDASIVVGPLNKKALEALAEAHSFPVPTLALNQLEDNEYYDEKLYQFGLPPEEEARQVAERAWLDGHNRAAAIYPSGQWGERVFNAFKQRWEELGGTVVAANDYNAKKSDFSPPLKAMLNLDQSNARYKSLRTLLRTRLDYEPRRRQDVDMIFMAAFPRQARLIPPQLKFHRAGDIPVYSTSHAFSGNISRSKDRDMNGVIIGDMPWTIVQRNPHPLKETIAKTWPDDAQRYSRLYALGVDAFNVLYYLNWLRTNPNASLAGATGKLSMDNRNRVLRTLSWAQFKSGRPRITASNLGLNQQP